MRTPFLLRVSTSPYKSHQPFGLRCFSGKSSSLNPLGKGLPLPLPQSSNRLTRKPLEHLIAASLLPFVFFPLFQNRAFCRHRMLGLPSQPSQPELLLAPKTGDLSRHLALLLLSPIFSFFKSCFNLLVTTNNGTSLGTNTRPSKQMR